MITAGNPTSGSTTAAAPAGDPNDPNAAHQSGIWLFETVDGKAKMSQMRASPIDEVKTRQQLRRRLGWRRPVPRHPLRDSTPRSNSPRRSLYSIFISDKDQEGLSTMGSMATAADDFSLATMEEHKDKGERHVQIGKYTMGGSRIGLGKKTVQALTVEKVADRVYKVTPASSLKSRRICLRLMRAARVVWAVANSSTSASQREVR